MKRILIGALALMALVIPVAQVAAAPVAPGATGSKLGVISSNCTPTCPTRYIAADTPFHVFHLWVCNPTPLYTDQYGNIVPGIGTAGCMASDFRLWIDGVKTADITTKIYWTDPNTGKKVLASKGNLTNFPNGLPVGTYQFYWEFWKNGTLTLSGTTPVNASNCVTTGINCSPPA